MKSKEIEFKYFANNLNLTTFKEFCIGRNPVSYKQVSGYDTFFSNPEKPQTFYRYREDGEGNKQLTFKRKEELNNSFVRTEHNIELAKEGDFEHIINYIEEHDYTRDASIFKSCFIYNFEWYTLVYYVCYDDDMRELGRFIEIEMKENYPWLNQQHAWGELVTLERICKRLGCKKEERLVLSLYEMYGRKGNLND